MSIQLSPTKFIDVFFNILEEKAKDPNVTDQDIVDNIGNFLIRTKYMRSVYEMHFSGFHRARCQSFDSIEDACKEFGNVSGLSCPPPERVSRPSRCNLPGVSVFYCSPDSGVTIFEVRPSLGQYVVLSRFTPKQGDRFEMLLPIIGVKQIRSSFSTRDPNDPIFSLLAKDLHFKGTHKFILEIDDRIAHYFVQPVNDSNQYIYRISTGFYNAFKEYGDMGEDEINSLLYPSVESRVTGFNIVIEPQVLENLKITSAIIYKVEDLNNKKYTLRPAKQLNHIIDNGDIVWEDVPTSNDTWVFDPDTPTYSFDAKYFS